VQIAAVLNAFHKEPRLRSFTGHFLILERGLIRRSCTTGATGMVYLHVDDLVLAHRCPRVVRAALRVASAALRAIGFLLEVTEPGEVEKVIGVTLSECGTVLSPPVLKIGSLDRGLEELENSDLFPPDVAATMLGLYIFYGLTWRASLSAPAIIFQWTATYRGCKLAPVWPSIKKEVSLMRACLPFLQLKLALPVLPALLAQDAAGPSDSQTGDGLADNGSFVMAIGFPPLATLSQIWSARDVRGATVGALSESPLRSGALGIMDRVVAQRTGETPEWIPVSGVSARATAEVPWFHLLSGGWRWRDHVNLGESRPVLAWLKLAYKAGIRGLGLSDLSDNRSTLALYGKGRAAPWRANGLGRRRATVEAYTGNRESVSWVSTVFQVADEGTRGEGSNVIDQEVRRLHPPLGVVLDLTEGGAVDRGILASYELKSFSPSWDLATLRGRGRLGVMIAHGAIPAIVWRLKELGKGVTVETPAAKHSLAAARRWADDPTGELERAQGEGEVRVRELLRLVERAGEDLADDDEEPVYFPPVLVIATTTMLRRHPQLARNLTAVLPQTPEVWLEHWVVFATAGLAVLPPSFLAAAQASAPSSNSENPPGAPRRDVVRVPTPLSSALALRIGRSLFDEAVVRSPSA
jgi:hypothetical protein